MNKLKEISFKDRKAIFGRLESLASQANMTKEERAQYRHEWKVYNDYFNSVDTAKKEGHAEGRAEGLMEGLEKECSHYCTPPFSMFSVFNCLVLPSEIMMKFYL